MFILSLLCASSYTQLAAILMAKMLSAISVELYASLGYVI